LVVVFCFFVRVPFVVGWLTKKEEEEANDEEQGG